MQTNQKLGPLKIALSVLIIILIIICLLFFNLKNNKTEVSLTCTLEDETHNYSIKYNESKITAISGDELIINGVDSRDYQDGQKLVNDIKDYFQDLGGSCTQKNNE